MATEMVNQTKVLNDVRRSLDKLEHTLGKLISAIEHTNQLEVNRLRNIQLQNELDR